MDTVPALDRKAERRQIALWGAALVGLVVAAFWPVFRAGFIWDDDLHVTGNTLLRSAGGLVKLWTDPAAFHQFYPLAQTSWWLEYQVWGAWAPGYHATNLVIHAISVLLVWKVLRELKVGGAWLAAALFAVHPMQVETVAWVMERKNLLSGLFYLLAGLAFMRFFGLVEGAGRRRWYALGLGAFVLALLSKTVAATLPAALLLVVWWKRGRIGRREWLAMGPLLVMGMAAGAWTGWLEREMVGARGPEWAFSAGDRVILAGRDLWHYAWKFVAPRPLMFFYPKWELKDHAAWQYLFPLAFLGMVGALWAGRGRWGRGPVTGVLFFAGTLVPALGFVNVYPMKYSFVADHFQYLACVGLASLIAGMGVELVCRRPRWRGVVAGAGGVAVGGLALLSMERSLVFRSELALYSDLVAKNPGSGPGHELLATVLTTRKEFGKAFAQWSEAAALLPEDLNTREGYGNALFDIGRVEEAQRVLEEVLRRDPRRDKIHVDLARVYTRLGRVAEAEALYRKAIEVDPVNSVARFNLGGLLAGSGRFREAGEAYAKALELTPEWPEATLLVGTCLAEQGRLGEAVVYFERAAALRPGWEAAERAAAMARAELGRGSGGGGK